jgi:hypothetical protein
MKQTRSSELKTLALFEKRFAGDDALLRLAQAKFKEAGMGAEVHAGTPEQLQEILKFRPSLTLPVVVHLPRSFDLVEATCRQQIVELVQRCGESIDGVVLHDHSAIPARHADYVAAAWKLEEMLEDLGEGPMVFVEYAAGLEPGSFTRFFRDILDLERVSACIDIGHVGIRAARAVYARQHGGEDVCGLKSQGQRLPHLIGDVQASVAAGASAVFELIDLILATRKAVHFHLHDGHPLSAFSPFGVADHLSFGTEIPLPFEYQGRRGLPTMFGQEGLSKLVAHALHQSGARGVSFTLEIHPTEKRLALGDSASFFSHWADLTNAERMNQWLEDLTRNHEVLRQAIEIHRKSLAPALSAPQGLAGEVKPVAGRSSTQLRQQPKAVTQATVAPASPVQSASTPPPSASTEFTSGPCDI